MAGANPGAPLDKLTKKAKATVAGFAELGIETVLDLLMFFPYRHIDRNNFITIGHLLADSIPKEPVVVMGTVDYVSTNSQLSGTAHRYNRGKSRVQVKVDDQTGSISCIFFNQPWRATQLKQGMLIYLVGKITMYRGRPQMANPLVDLVGDKVGKLVPLYPQSEKAKQYSINSAKVHECISEALRRAKQRGFADPVPEDIRQQYGFCSRGEALYNIHIPKALDDYWIARNRLVFDELFRMQVWLIRNKARVRSQAGGIQHIPDAKLLESWQGMLPFQLTGGQREAIESVSRDMSQRWPMQRLLQGDVGSGKTAVALAAILISAGSGHQSALMSPTEVLAEQSFAIIREYLQKGGEALLSVPTQNALQGTLQGTRELQVALLSSSVGQAQRKKILEGLKIGNIDVVVGTHALIQKDVEFKSLGLVVIDEQQRFGVEQRDSLLRNNLGNNLGNGTGEELDLEKEQDHRKHKSGLQMTPDLLVMTGTPIPRTAAMTLLGDMDVTELNEIPAGRMPVQTIWVKGAVGIEQMWEQVSDEISKGRQVFVVCPVIDLNADPADISGVLAIHEELSQRRFTDCSVGLLHGRLKPEQKEQVMENFKLNKTQILSATTVIEVGVDVPNATVMVIMDAQRFGLAQLHQLRGRVGRGTYESKCFLVGDAPTDLAQERFEAMLDTTDGFELAKRDLAMRGEGTIMGSQQSGRPSLILARLVRDEKWIKKARTAAEGIVESDPDLETHAVLRDEISRMLSVESASYLTKT